MAFSISFLCRNKIGHMGFFAFVSSKHCNYRRLVFSLSCFFAFFPSRSQVLMERPLSFRGNEKKDEEENREKNRDGKRKEKEKEKERTGKKGKGEGVGLFRPSTNIRYG